MFSSDKDLRKAPSKAKPAARPVRKPAATATNADADSTAISAATAAVAAPTDSSSSSSNSGSNSNDIVAKAKSEREHRELVRRQAAKVLRIQKWYRGRKASRAYTASLVATIQSKLGDIRKVSDDRCSFSSRVQYARWFLLRIRSNLVAF
jgi:hypothetical protein